MNKFTTLLNEAIQEKGLTKSQVAESFGWTPMYFGRYCNGQLFPTKANIDKFANFLGISKEKLESIIKE